MTRGPTDSQPVNRKLLLTGAGGFIGRPLQSRLESEGHEVRGLTRADGDICDIPADLCDCDMVLHLAARAFVPDSWEHPEEVFRVNAQGTVHLLEACRTYGTPLVLMSTYAYGAPQYLPIDEAHPTSARNPYAMSKLAAEEAALFYRESFDLPVTILRPFNPYGPGQPDHFLIPEILNQLLDPSTESVALMDLEPKRDLLYLDDLLTAVMSLLPQATGGIFNVGSGVSHSVREIAETAMDVTGIRKPLVSKGTPRKNEIPDVIADCSALRKATGWEPQVDLHRGLTHSLESLQT